MKNYNKILEAINRGIKFALDDFDDNDELQGQVNSKVKYQGGTKEWLDLIQEVVDLDLPSGTLWCKYNLDVDPNQLTKAKGWYGKYFAWGELEGNKPKYDWKHYKFDQNNSNSELTKYNKNDNLTELQPEDDVAYQNKKFYNYKFHMPTKEQCEELINYTSNYWVKNYNPNKIIHSQIDDGGIQGLNGRVFVGKNANQLFIPATGYYGDSKIGGVSSHCDLWSSSLYVGYPYYAYYLYIDSTDIYMDQDTRYFGYSVRPVINL